MEFNKAIDNLMGLVTGSKDPLALNAVMEVQKHLILIQEENRQLREEIHSLKNDRITESNLVYKNHAYYKMDNDDNAYCSKCFETERKLITLSKQAPMLSTTYEFKCPNCNNKFDSGIIHNLNTDIPF
ncbi:hypothetical protein [Enterococcus gallinarum]|uniref:hypothetical protein n=1 Tax=Enterococcus gallinarum TaxID=1353 RepID=UPI002DB8E722|nr:hypothetical protein [Enterococcus gallinarum]MEB5968592.1 hypothetical protein [Enterococcus gallinarum]